MDHHDEEEKRETINNSIDVYNDPSNGEKSRGIKKVKLGAKNFSQGTNQDHQKQILIQEETRITENELFMNYMEMNNYSESDWNCRERDDTSMFKRFLHQ